MNKTTYDKCSIIFDEIIQSGSELKTILKAMNEEHYTVIKVNPLSDKLYDNIYRIMAAIDLFCDIESPVENKKIIDHDVIKHRQQIVSKIKNNL